MDDKGEPLLNEAIEAVLRYGKASVSHIQRTLRVGYTRAARIVDLLEEMGIVGPAEDNSPYRKIIKYVVPAPLPTSDIAALRAENAALREAGEGMAKSVTALRSILGNYTLRHEDGSLLELVEAAQIAPATDAVDTALAAWKQAKGE